jgi:hypothetical protein
MAGDNWTGDDPAAASHFSANAKELVAVVFIFTNPTLSKGSLITGDDEYAQTLLCTALRWALVYQLEGMPWTWDTVRATLYATVSPPVPSEARNLLDGFQHFDMLFDLLRTGAEELGVEPREFAEALHHCRAIMAELRETGELKLIIERG